MALQLSPKDLQGLIVTCTGCLCLLILVMGTIFGVIKGVISPDKLGHIDGLSVGGGLLGLGLIIYYVIRIAFKRGAER